MIGNVPTATFNTIIEELVLDGWKKTYIHDAFDAWIDYGKVVLKKKGEKLVFTWDNWIEGTIMGSQDVLLGLQNRCGAKSMLYQRGRRGPIRLILEIIGIIVAGAGFGLVAVYFRLLDHVWVVIILGIIIIALIVYGVYLGKKMWEENDWPD